MNLEDILECLNDGYEFDNFQRTVVPAALAQDLILKAASLHKPRWINSEERLPELIAGAGDEFSDHVLVYFKQNHYYMICPLVFVPSNTNGGYFWLQEGTYKEPIKNTYWMPLPTAPKV